MNENHEPPSGSKSEVRAKAERSYKKIGHVHCPYFQGPVAFTSDGFHHLRYTRRRERPENAQLLKLRLLPWAPPILKASGTVQEYRRLYVADEKKGKDGLKKTRLAEQWGFSAIVGNKKRIVVRVIVQQIGDGKPHFWSIMIDTKLTKKLAGREILEDDE